MTDQNPYASPENDILEDDILELDLNDEYELAGRWIRLLATWVDGLVLVIPAFVLFFIIGFAFAVLEVSKLAPIVQQIIWGVVYLFAYSFLYFVFNYNLLKKNGQTIGKKALKIKIVKDNGGLPTITDSFFKRFLLTALLVNIPIFGSLYGLIDSLMIFRKNRKCIHDEIAGTKVINLKKRKKVRDDSDDHPNESESSSPDVDLVGFTPNARKGDNLFQGIFILVCVAIGSAIGWFLSPDMTGVLGGILAGLVSGLFLSGIILMIKGWFR